MTIFMHYSSFVSRNGWAAGVFRMIFRRIWENFIWLSVCVGGSWKCNGSDSNNGFFLCIDTMEVVISNNKIKFFSTLTIWDLYPVCLGTFYSWPKCSWYCNFSTPVRFNQLKIKPDLNIWILHTFCKRIFNKLLDMIFLKTDQEQCLNFNVCILKCKEH